MARKTKKPTKKKRERKKKLSTKKETNPIKAVVSSSTYIYKKSDFVEVDEEFNKDLEQVKAFKKNLEQGELKWSFFSMGVHYYKKTDKYE